VRRLAPTLLAAALALAYVVISPPSLDLAAHLLRAKLFATEGFGLWNNWWYAGHNTPGYSVLFPPLAAALSPQVVGAASAVGTAALFEALAHRRFGREALLGSLWFGAATAVDLFTGRLTFAFGLLPAFGAALALQRRRDGLAGALAVLTALASPVAALFAALAAVATAIGRRTTASRVRALAVAAGALVPVLILVVLFPEGGSEPFTLATLWPVLLIAVGALLALRGDDRTLRAGIVLYLAGCLAAYLITTPVGSNAARLAPLLGGPVAALLWWPRHRWLLAVAALPLLYIQWQAPVRDVRTASGDPSTTVAYYQPLLRFLARQPGPPFRVEIPFTKFHWEAYEVAPAFPLARGWERQLDTKDNSLFYGHTGPNSQAYRQWLHELAIRFVAVSAATPDYSAIRETALIDRGLPYLRLVWHTRDWRVYAVRRATPLVQGPARLRAVGANSVALEVTGTGPVLVRVRFTPYWALTGTPGCVEPAGPFTRIRAARPGPARLVIRFALSRARATSPRCSRPKP
jgi:hypothetical protein